MPRGPALGEPDARWPLNQHIGCCCDLWAPQLTSRRHREGRPATLQMFLPGEGRTFWRQAHRWPTGGVLPVSRFSFRCVSWLEKAGGTSVSSPPSGGSRGDLSSWWSSRQLDLGLQGVPSPLRASLSPACARGVSLNGELPHCSTSAVPLPPHAGRGPTRTAVSGPLPPPPPPTLPLLSPPHAYCSPDPASSRLSAG